jgi:hypothetical protein
MKTRSSSGVNSKIDLGFDVDTLRIFDLDEDEEDQESTATTSGKSIVNQIKRSSQTKTDWTDTTAQVEMDPVTGKPIGKVSAQIDSTNLRNFLNSHK